jgi:MFS family permease
MISATFMPAALAMLEGGVLGVIAKKAFDAPDVAIALISAAPVMANMASFLWTRAAYGRDRVRIVNLAQFGLLASLLVLALAPAGTAVGLWVLLLASIAGRVCMTGILTVRADVWRANYPRQVRFHVTGNFTIVTAGILALFSLVAGYVLDSNERSYHAIFPIAAGLGFIGAMSFRKIRWRQGRSYVRAERRETAQGNGKASPVAMLRVLRDDRSYRFYMMCQFVLGIANLSIMPPFIKALDETFGLPYGSSIALTTAIPIGMMVIALPFWARFLTKVHVMQFRAIHSWFFVVAIGLTAVGMLWQALWVIYVSRVLIGFARGGGALAWSLGHHDFASRQMAPIYMGLHVTLTGIRGAIGPFLGMFIYAGFQIPLGALAEHLRSPVELLSSLGVKITPDNVLQVPGMGAGAFVLLTVLAFLGATGFVCLAITHRDRLSTDEEP